MLQKNKQQIIQETDSSEQESILGEKRKTRKKQPPKGSRWMILILFLLTLVVTGIFYLKTALPPLWQKWTAPLIISNVKPEDKFDASSVLAEIQNLTKDLRGKYGFYVYELKDNNSYGLYQNEVFPSASLMKLPVILCFYQEVEKGNLSLIGEYSLKEKDKVSGAGILQGKTVGTTYTYQQLIEYMGQYSDNTAFKVMRGILTDEKIQKTIDKLGMKNTSLVNFETSPEDIGLFFKELYQGEIISDLHKDSLLKFLTKTAFENWLPAGLPKDIKIAHKIGKDIGTFSDGGIVFTDKPYVIVVMSKDAKETEANEFLPKINGSVWEWENSVKSL
ncbi:MAG: class A beta-lactamase-related serine hydrolase [Candidatus Shapirobacteria bacterium]|nr:class A beta-lactamase-related serine hydrolase [Candidatus Shapirobacteria bacterium]